MTDTEHDDEKDRANPLSRPWSLRDERARLATDWSMGVCVGSALVFILIEKAHILGGRTLLLAWLPTFVAALTIAVCSALARKAGYLAPLDQQPKKIAPRTIRPSAAVIEAGEAVHSVAGDRANAIDTSAPPSEGPKPSGRQSGIVDMGAAGRVRFWVPDDTDRPKS